MIVKATVKDIIKPYLKERIDRLLREYKETVIESISLLFDDIVEDTAEKMSKVVIKRKNEK